MGTHAGKPLVLPCDRWHMPVHTFPKPERSPEPIVSSPDELARYHDLAAGLRSYLGDSYDESGRLSTLLLASAIHRIEDLFTFIEYAERSTEVLVWGPLQDLPDCVTRAGGMRLARNMLILLSDFAKQCSDGFTQPDTAIGALALEIVLAEAHFLAELWDLEINVISIDDLRDPLMIDTDHLYLYQRTRKLSKKAYRDLFESQYEHPNGANGLNPYVEMP